MKVKTERIKKHLKDCGFMTDDLKLARTRHYRHYFKQYLEDEYC